jgi:hypothetical protein
MQSLNSAIILMGFAIVKKVNEKPRAHIDTIQIELVPDAYTSPGPPTKPKPLKVLENIARPIKTGPRDLPAAKKSEVDFVL